MKRKQLSTMMAGVLMLGSSASFAYSNGGDIDYARVTNVHPVTRSVTINTPRQECWSEQVAVRNQSGGRSFTAEILGGVLGAAVGRQFGSGRGQDAATVAGAVLGGSIGRDIKNRKRNGGYYDHNQHGGYETVERCETINDSRIEQRVIGYDVTYQYNGSSYTTRMDRDPGDEIKVRVSVSPIH